MTVAVGDRAGGEYDPRSMMLSRFSFVLAAVALASCSDTVVAPPEDVPPNDAPPVDMPIEDLFDAGAEDVVVRDRPAEDTTVVDVPREDVARDTPVVDVPPVDVAPVDVPRDTPAVDVPRDTSTTTDVTDGGTMNACTTPVSLPMSQCSASLCGNGRVDTCPQCTPCRPPGGGPSPPLDAGVCCTTVNEECDGTALGAATCESLGYARGTLRCGRWCGYDTTGCDSCEISARVSNCVQADVDAVAPTALALATNEGDIAVAWVSGQNPDGTTGVHFARYSASLERIAESRCLGLAGAAWVDLAVTPDGWMMAAASGTQTNLYVFPITGLPTTPARTIMGATVPQFTGRPSDAPLLRWVTGSSTQAALLNRDGTNATAPVTVFTNLIEAGYGGGAYTGDAFLLGEREGGAITVARVDLSGRVTNRTTPLGSSTEYPQLAWTGTEARLTGTRFGVSTPDLAWVRLDRTGAAVGSPVSLGAVPQYFNPTPMVGAGNDTVAVLGAYTGITGGYSRIEVGRISSAGSISSRVTINRDRNPASRARIVSFRGSYVVGWIGGGFPGRVMLARLVI